MARSVSRWPPCAAGSTSQPRPPDHSTLPVHRSPWIRAGGSAGTLNVTGSTFSGNDGGGIFNSGTLAVTDSTFSDNSAGEGGGIYNQAGMITLTGSTFNSNIAGRGGGIRNAGGTLTVTDSTFSDNRANSIVGGGIDNSSGTLTVTNSTFAGNRASLSGGGIYNGGTGTLRNTIVANSPSGGNCGGNVTLTDGGGNLVWGDTTCPGVNADPKLLALANNGGPTGTMALDMGRRGDRRGGGCQLSRHRPSAA